MLTNKEKYIFARFLANSFSWVTQHQFFKIDQDASFFIFRDRKCKIDDEIVDCVVKTEVCHFTRLPSTTLINELFVGCLGIEKLKGTPFEKNFAKIVGFNNGITLNQDIHNISDISGLKQYDIAYQFINGITFYEFLFRPSTTCKIVMNVLTELFGALKFANDAFGFTHYDLHTKNVLITKSNTPVVIDYEFSHIVYNRKSSGVEIATISPMSCWQYDVVKLMCSILVSIDSESQEIYYENKKKMDLNNEKQDQDFVSKNETDFIDIIKPKHYDYFPTHLENLVDKLLFMLSFFWGCDINKKDIFTTQFLEPPLEKCLEKYSFDDFMLMLKTLMLKN